MLRQLDKPPDPSSQDPMSGSWVFRGATNPNQPRSLTVDVQVAGNRLGAVIRASGISEEVARLSVTVDLTLSRGLINGKLGWSASGRPA